MRISLSNRLALVFFGVTLVAIGALYAYVAPGLQHRLVQSRVGELRRRRDALLGTDRGDRLLGGPRG